MRISATVLIFGASIWVHAAPPVLSPGNERLVNEAASRYLMALVDGDLRTQAGAVDDALIERRQDVYTSSVERANLRSVYLGSTFEIRKVGPLSDNVVAVYARISRPDGGAMDWMGFFRHDEADRQYRLTGEEDKLSFCADNPLDICR